MNFIQGAWSTAGNILNNLLPQNEWKKIGKVVELNLYPLMNGKKVSVEKALCTNQGLKYENIYDWNFVVFELESKKVCTLKEYPGLVKIDLSYDSFEESVTLRARNKCTEVIPLSEFWLDELFDVILHPDQMFFLRDCGEVAAAWLTDSFANRKTKLRLGLYEHCGAEQYNEKYENYLIENPNCKMYRFSDHLDSKNRFTLLNTASFDRIKSKLFPTLLTITKSDLYPNIVIKTDGPEPFPEFTLKDIKIGECMFETIQPCTQCTIAKVAACYKDSYFKKKNYFYILKDNLSKVNKRSDINAQKGFNAEPVPGSSVTTPENCMTPSMTVDLKFSNDAQRTIKRGDEVYIKISN